MKKVIRWNLGKNRKLLNDETRGNINFEDCVIAIEEKRVLADLPNPSDKRDNQRIYILEINSYAYVVPYVENDEEIFLKTIFPSRKHTAIYLINDENE